MFANDIRKSENNKEIKDKLVFKGQVSVSVHFYPSIDLPNPKKKTYIFVLAVSLSVPVNTTNLVL